MQVDLIDTFLDLCDTRSFNQTADRLGVTQSTVSARIKSLEASVGARLFQRSRSGTALTTAGLRFEPHARGLRHSWSTALNAARDVSLGGTTMRIGLQHDVVDVRIRGLVDELRETFPQTVFLLEADYSGQLCSDLMNGTQDIAVLYSPRMMADLTFDMFGEVSYVMVSSVTNRLSEIDKDNYIFGNFAPAFAQSHAALLPHLENVSLSIGQSAAMVALLKSLKGSGYVLKSAVEDLVSSGEFRVVSDAPVITQPIFIGLNTRNRHRRSYQKLKEILRERL